MGNTTSVQLWQICQQLYPITEPVLYSRRKSQCCSYANISCAIHWKELRNQISHEALHNMQLNCLDKTCDLFTHWQVCSAAMRPTSSAKSMHCNVTVWSRCLDISYIFLTVNKYNEKNKIKNEFILPSIFFFVPQSSTVVQKHNTVPSL